MALPRSLLNSLLPRLKPLHATPVIHLTTRQASYSLGSFRLPSFLNRKPSTTTEESETTSLERELPQGKGLYDTAVEEGTKISREERRKVATFVRFIFPSNSNNAGRGN